MTWTLVKCRAMRSAWRDSRFPKHGLIRARIPSVTTLLTKETAMIAGFFAAGLCQFHSSDDIRISLVSRRGTSKMLSLSNYLGTFLPS